LVPERCAIIAVFWVIWLERKKRIFEKTRGMIFNGMEFVSFHLHGL
jgi:hypothetical protein